MGKIIDLSGRRFGRLFVLSFDKIKKNRAIWLCKCDCGNTSKAIGKNLLNGDAKSCGCIKKEILIGNSFSKKHGLVNSPSYRTWSGMKVRCLNKNHHEFHRYGGRGISICARWMIFENFLADMGDRPEGMTLDRIDANGNYEPSNCRWATSKQQARNTSTNRWILINGEKLCLKEAAEKYGIKRTTLGNRLNRGWSQEKALNLPIRGTKCR